MAGDPETIQRWSIWTPTQLSLMKMATELPRVILTGGNGTGKTTMLDFFAMKTAEDKKEKVIFAIQQEKNLSEELPLREPLLHLSLENKYKKQKNIIVKSFTDISELKDIESHIFIDEVDLSYINSPEEIHGWQNMAAKTIWIVVRNTPIDPNLVGVKNYILICFDIRGYFKYCKIYDLYKVVFDHLGNVETLSNSKLLCSIFITYANKFTSIARN